MIFVPMFGRITFLVMGTHPLFVYFVNETWAEGCWIS